FIVLFVSPPHLFSFFFFFHDPATPDIYPLSLHDALPISIAAELSDEEISALSSYMQGLHTRPDAATLAAIANMPAPAAPADAAPAAPAEGEAAPAADAGADTSAPTEGEDAGQATEASATDVQQSP